jgi:EAL domain-containing protein (putative c-di-GMP-specific phosphodiesterase class I)
LAEEIGLIVPLGQWILQHACQVAASWPEHVRLAVNLSPVQFQHPALVSVITSALVNAGLSPDRLELEITEGVLMQNDPATVDMLHQLKALGVRIALDDFGTGYSSLSYLRSFPFDKIKIDRSFVADMESRADAAAIVQAVASLGASLGMTTTAEGIETQAQLDRLRAEGCTQVQGFLLSHPLDEHGFRALLRKENGNSQAA